MSVKMMNEEKPEIGKPVVIYRPETLYPTCREKPLAIAIYDGEIFNCHIQPLQWIDISLPEDWTDAHTKYQRSEWIYSKHY